MTCGIATRMNPQTMTKTHRRLSTQRDIANSMAQARQATQLARHRRTFIKHTVPRLSQIRQRAPVYFCRVFISSAIAARGTPEVIDRFFGALQQSLVQIERRNQADQHAHQQQEAAG